MFGKQEEEFLEEDDTTKEINDEYELDVKMEHFDESDLDSVSEDKKDVLHRILMGENVVLVFENRSDLSLR